MSTVEQLKTRVEQQFGSTVTCKITHAELTVELAYGDLLACCQILRDQPDFQFEQLMDLCGVDYLTYGVGEWETNNATSQGFSRAVNKTDVGAGPSGPMPNRFAVVYHLLSITRNQRIRLRVFTHGEPPRVPSVISIWKSADWYEREAFDLYGILFEGHPDLRRILTDYGFVGHPFRKDFPLIGEVEMRYDASEGRVVYEPVSIEPRTLVPKVIRHVGQPAPEKPQADKVES
jgi:NADH-quinone oxidoreductase subunit C